MLTLKPVSILHIAIFRQLEPITNVNTNVESTIGANSNTDTNTVRSTEVAPPPTLQLGTDVDTKVSINPPHWGI
ncbi:hypothetical protein NIES2101_34700 [Calothrix sp. HK-06]|nr:hypothetical protein NIES2101_34700 [Calothrix sp. HK-06]